MCMKLDKLPKREKANDVEEVYVILHNIRSVHNVGSIFRTADAAGVYHMCLTGYTPTPRDRFQRIRKDFAKVALGAEHMSWEYTEDPVALIKRLKKTGVQIVGIEQAPTSKHYKKVIIKKPVAFLFGNEVEGVPKELLALCDDIAEIPMAGKKESLNVSVSAGIALFGMLDR